MRTRSLTARLSNGTVGYVHVRGMNGESFRETGEGKDPQIEKAVEFLMPD